MNNRSRYPIELIEKDYIVERLTFEELSKKYGISMNLLKYHSPRKHWVIKRDEYYAKTQQKCLEQEAKRDAKAQIKAKDITVDWLIEKTENITEKAETRNDFSNVHRGIENIARFVGIDKQSSIITNVYHVASNSVDKNNLTELLNQRLSQSPMMK